MIYLVLILNILLSASLQETYDNATAPSNPSTSDHNSHGYMIWDSSGYVKVDSPKPAIGNNTAPTGDIISKMEWDDIHKIVEQIGGN